MLALALAGDPERGGGVTQGRELDDVGVQGEVNLALTTCSGARHAGRRVLGWRWVRGPSSVAWPSVPTAPSSVPSGPAMEAHSEVALPPQPVETCSFCFPERSSPTQESTRTLGILGLAGTAAPQPCVRASVGGLGVVRVPIGDAGPGA